MVRSWLLCAAVLSLGGCGGGDADLDQACNPLGFAGCVAPWPSSIYEIDDPSTATGVRLDLAVGALPTNVDGKAIDPAPLNRRDGFSPASHMFIAFPGGVDPSNLSHWDDYAGSLADTSPTVILDLATGERVAHFAEIDVNAGTDYDHQALYLRPASRLEGATRYAVGIRRSLRARDGGELPSPPGYAAIRDGAPFDHPRLERVRPRYEEIFAAFEAAGVPADDLVVAWDFTTASDAALIADMLGARDAALAAMGPLAADMDYTVDSDEPRGDGSQIAREVSGTFTSPLVVAGPNGADGLARDGDGAPMVIGTMDAPFVILVPSCPAELRPYPIVVFGHGFFGGLSETRGGYVSRFAQERCVVIVGTDWYGMRTADISVAALSLNDANLGLQFGERIVQGIINMMTVSELARGALSSELLSDGGGALADPERIYFYGISQGSILGGTFMATYPHIERGTLHVGGANWTMLFERSSHWQAYGTILGGAYPGPLNKVIMQALLQMAFDYTDPIHTARRVLDDPLPGVPAKQLLIQFAVGDTQVTSLSTEHQARTMGLAVLGPALYAPYGVEEVDGPLPSALVIYDEKPTPLPPRSNALVTELNDTHDSLRRRAAVIEQIGTFFETGEVVHTCGDDTPCDCSTGACGPTD